MGEDTLAGVASRQDTFQDLALLSGVLDLAVGFVPELDQLLLLLHTLFGYKEVVDPDNWDG